MFRFHTRSVKGDSPIFAGTKIGTVPIIFLLAVSLAGMAGCGGPVIGEDLRVDNALQAIGDNFRVDNAVYASDQKEPLSRSVTIFHDGVVYDCMKTPAETVVFDKAAKRFVLLNMTNRTRAELSIREVTAFIKRLQPLAAKSADPVVKFLADPKFEERFDQAAGELTLSSPLVSYRLLLATGDSKVAAEQYREFSDWYARLNSLLSPGSRPPFGRLAVNAAIAKRRAIASQVVLTLSSGKPGRRPTIMRSTHHVVRPLTTADLEQVARTRKSMVDFKLVDFEKYRKSGPK